MGEDASNNGTIPILEVNTYEVPVSGSASACAMTQAVRMEPDHEYELTESTYAMVLINFVSKHLDI